MSAPTTIRSLSISDLDIPLLAPFQVGAQTQFVVHNLLLRLELADGTVGYGEAAPPFSADGSTRSELSNLLNHLRPSIEGGDIREWRRIAEQFAAAPGPARCALESALLDAFTRQARLPLWAFFGGANTLLESSITIPSGDIAQATVAALETLRQGFTTIKLKLSGDILRDLACAIAIHQVAPQQPLILDGNGGMAAERGLELLAALHMQNIRPVLFEQPVPADDWQGMEQLAAWGGVPIATDESINGIADLLRLVYERRAQVVTIKLMKSGLIEALDMVAICRAAGLGLMISSMLETPLGISVAACFAAGLGGFRFIDLDTPYFMAEVPLSVGYTRNGGRFDLSGITAGHGTTPKAQPTA
jgi:L-Ala-D/L-Glu epimerase